MGVEDELLVAARSSAYVERMQAARALSAFVGHARVDAAMVDLVLDGEDTAVGVEAAEVLLEREDAAGFRVLAVGWHRADPTTLDHLMAAFSGALFTWACSTPQHRDHVRGVLNGLVADTDPEVAAGATDLLARVTYALPD